MYKVWLYITLKIEQKVGIIVTRKSKMLKIQLMEKTTKLRDIK